MAFAALTRSLSSVLKYFFPGSFSPVRRSPYGLPLPEVSHKVLSEEELGERELLIVGDVHGCYDELVELLDECNGRDPTVCVVFVGDLVNKGPKSAEVVRLAREIGAYCVRGNHDEISLFEWQKHMESGAPLPLKFQWLHQLSQEELNWAHSLPYTISVPSKGIVIAHAGLVPGVELTQQDPDHMLHMRDLTYCNKSSKWIASKSPMNGSAPWGSVWPGPEVVYFGHDARRLFQTHPYAIGLDTGCVYGGKLTAVFPGEGNRLVQVQAHTVNKQPGGKAGPKGEEASGSRD